MKTQISGRKKLTHEIVNIGKPTEGGLGMKRIMVILIVLAVGGYFAYAYFQGKAEEKRIRIVQNGADKKEWESGRAEVAQMVVKYNASSDWEDKLPKVKSKLPINMPLTV